MSDLTRLEIDAKFARLELEINGLRLEISRLHPIPLKSENKEFCKSIAERLEALEKAISAVSEEHKETKNNIAILEAIAKEHDYKVNRLWSESTTWKKTCS